MKRDLRHTVSLLLITGTVVILDQASKALIRHNLALGEVYRPDLWISQVARFVHVKNYGSAIGFPSLGKVFMLLAILVSAAILYYAPRLARQGWQMRLSTALILGGVMGNLIDRLHQGYVTDFISLLSIPVVNLADLSIASGVILLISQLWQQEKKQKPGPVLTHPDDQQSDPPEARQLTNAQTRGEGK